ncbi:MAG: hypothetical protein H6757_02625 [Candidatus Omnitrophica bacterium]|nr:hypothetical protein [Candidatus Omnitrophota bacterium]
MNDSVTYETFIKKLSQYELTSALTKISQLSCLLEQESRVVAELELSKQPGRLVCVSQWALAYISFELILHASDFSIRTITADEILILCNWYTNIEEYLDEQNGGWEHIIVRMAQEQMPFQEMGHYQFSRGYFLLKNIGANLDTGSAIDLEKAFIESLGVSIDDYYWICWAINSRAHNKKTSKFTPRFFLNHGISKLKEILTEMKLEKVITSICASPEKIKQEYADFPIRPSAGLEKYQFNLISKYPLLELTKKGVGFQNREYLILNSKSMQNKIMEGAYWVLRDHFLKQKSQAFVNYWGEIFEEYVGQILKKYYGDKNVLSLNDLFEEEKVKTADWLVDSNEEILIFECKSSLLPIDVKAVFNQEKFKKWCEDNILAGFEQLSISEDIIKKKSAIKNIDLKGKPIIKIMVTYQNLFLSSAWKTLLKIFFSNSLEWNETLSRLQEFKLMSTLDLELFENLSSEYALGEILSKTENNPQTNFQVLCGELAKGKLGNSLLENVKNDFWRPFLENVSGTKNGDR